MTTRMKEFRSACGLTQEDLANRVEVRRETVIFLEKGKYNPSLRLAYRTARALGTTIEELFSFEDEEWA
jgi:putative transcriptional regulator